MNLTLHSTKRFALLDGVQCRIWEGRTPSGAKVQAYVHRLRVDEKECTELESDLLEQAPPAAYEEQAPDTKRSEGCICVIKDGERFAHGHCLAFHKQAAVGYVTDPNTLTVQRGDWLGRP